MHFGIYKSTWYCRWCGKVYKPLKDTDRDGFCSPACKQAHHRAYKLYIDWKSGARRKRKHRALSRKKPDRKQKPGTRHSRNAKKAEIHIPKKEWNGNLPGPTLCGIKKSRHLYIEFWDSLRGKKGLMPIDQLVCLPCYKIYIKKRKQ